MSGVGSVILGQGSHNVGQAGQRSKTEPESLTLFSQPLLVTVELLNDWSLEGHPNSHQRRPKAPEKGTRDLDTLYTKKNLRGSNIGVACDSHGWEVTVALSDWFYQFFPRVPENIRNISRILRQCCMTQNGSFPAGAPGTQSDINAVLISSQTDAQSLES